jgi:hypothetical protein
MGGHLGEAQIVEPVGGGAEPRRVGNRLPGVANRQPGDPLRLAQVDLNPLSGSATVQKVNREIMLSCELRGERPSWTVS